MFNTLKLDRDTSEMQNIRETYDPVSARSSSHQACDRCHEKKLKCSGERTGCDRCISNDLLCQFERCISRGSRRGKHSHRRSGDSTGREASLPKSSSSQKSRSSRSQNSNQYSAPMYSQHERPCYDRRTPSTTSANSPEQYRHDDSSGPMLDRIDPELFRLEDGFVFPKLSIAEPSYAGASESDPYAQVTMPTTYSGHHAPQYQTSSDWYNSALSPGMSGYADPTDDHGSHEFDPYQYHSDYRQQRWNVSKSG